MTPPDAEDPEAGADQAQASGTSASPEPLGELPARLGPLVRDMRFALRSEFGAYSLYLLLPLVARNNELRKLLVELRREQRGQIEELRSIIQSLGGHAPASRWTRAVAAWALFLATPVCGMRLPLRLCCEAERTVSRWYGEYTLHLLEQGYIDSARRCQAMQRTKRIHATRLASFVAHLGGE